VQNAPNLSSYHALGVRILYLMKINASPATNLFELTKTLQPVVRRCLLGCPERNMGRQA